MVRDAGRTFLTSDVEIMLPALGNTKHPKSEASGSRSSGSRTRKGKGSHALTVIKQLISDNENWFPLTNSDDYNFPGVFDFPYPQRLGYCEDISQLPNYKVTPTSFSLTFNLGKGRHDQSVSLNLMSTGSPNVYTIVSFLVVGSNYVVNMQMVVPTLLQHSQQGLAANTLKLHYNALENVQWNLSTFGQRMVLTTAGG